MTAQPTSDDSARALAVHVTPGCKILGTDVAVALELRRHSLPLNLATSRAVHAQAVLQEEDLER
jgi:hypothetical protein